MRKSILTVAIAASFAATVTYAAGDDSYPWAEEIEGAPALDQAKKWNAETAAVLEKSPGFESYRKRALTILQDPAKIAYPDQVQRDRIVNLWQDAQHSHGLWRTASVASFVAGKPEWRTLIDLDALSKAEGKNWVWGGARCFQPTYERCMVGLSDGGTDVLIWREFDMASGRFVEGGFETTPAKSIVAWADRDTLLIRSDFGPGSLTTSGYGRQIRMWKRGTPLASAKLVFEGQTGDVWATPSVYVDGDRFPVVTRAVSFFEYDYSHVAPDGRLVRSPLPRGGEIQDVLDGRVIALLHADWTHGGKTHKAGSLVAYPIAPLLAGQPASVETVYAPTAAEAIEEVSAAKRTLYVKLLDNVSGKLLALTRDSDGWAAKPVPLAANSVVGLVATGGDADLAFASVEGMTTPESLYVVRPGAAPARIASLPPKFDAAKMEVSQRWATSKDGTRIPYFLVRPKGAKGPLPTIVHAYGGFRVAQNPVYLTKHPYRIGPVAQFWVEEGNAYVLANIRGGSEFGPKWHESVLKANRQKGFDDFHAVAEALKRDGAASKIAASGRSNGGLLVGVAYTQRPDLYDAVIMGVPLADMQRYTKMGAGASWIGEYGDPDKPEEWAYISKYSPLHNVRKDARYPKPFFYTSTKDDRVHPGHARKMAARMEALGHPFYYYENMEGGHAGAANHNEDAYRSALSMAYLNRELRGIGAQTANK